MTDLSLDKQMLQDVLRKSLAACSVAGESEVLEVCYRVSDREHVVSSSFSDQLASNRSVAEKQAALRMQLIDLAQLKVSYGYRRLYMLLRREGLEVG